MVLVSDVTAPGLKLGNYEYLKTLLLHMSHNSLTKNLATLQSKRSHISKYHNIF